MKQSPQNNFETEIQALQTLRDELKLKLHLAAADAKDEFHRLEKKWERLEEELQRTADHSREPLETIGAKAKELIRELSETYARIKPSFFDSSSRNP